MSGAGPATDVQQTMAAINQAWRDGRVRDMARHLHPDIVMKAPGFVATVTGRDTLLAGFEEFCANARVLEYRETDQHVDSVDDCAVVSTRFEMVYERPGYRERSTGWDVWMFRKSSEAWIAVWRTMVDVRDAREGLA